MKKIYSLCGVITCIWSYRTLYNLRVNFPDSAKAVCLISKNHEIHSKIHVIKHEIQLSCQLLNIEIDKCATIICSSGEGYKNKDLFLYIETFSSEFFG